MPPSSLPRARRPLRIAIGAALGLSVLSMVIVGAASVSVMRGAQEVLRVTAPSDAAVLGDPQAAVGLPFETLAIQTDLGPTEAWLVPEPFRPNAPQPHQAAIFVHDRDSTREDGYRFLPALQEAGIPALLISLRGDANAPASPDGLFGFGLTEWRDLEGALLALRDRGFSDVIVLADGTGASLVGQTLLQSDAAMRISAIALDQPVLDFGTVLERVAREQGWPWPALAARGGGLALRLRQPLDLHLARVTEPLAGFAGPMLVASDAGAQGGTLQDAEQLIGQRAAAGLADMTMSVSADPATDPSVMQRFLALANRP